MPVELGHRSPPHTQGVPCRPSAAWTGLFLVLLPTEDRHRLGSFAILISDKWETVSLSFRSLVLGEDGRLP